MTSQKALAAANQGPPEDEGVPIPIDFWDPNGESRIFDSLEKDKIGLALLNGRPVYVKRFSGTGRREVMVLKGRDPERGHWKTWEIMREELQQKKGSTSVIEDKLNIGVIIAGIRRELDVSSEDRRGKHENNHHESHDIVEARGHSLGNYLKNAIDGGRRTTVKLRHNCIEVCSNGGQLNIGSTDFFSVLEGHLRGLGQVKGNVTFSQKSLITEFKGEWNFIFFDAIRALVVTLDPTQNIRTRPNVKGNLQVESKYSSVLGLDFLTFDYSF